MVHFFPLTHAYKGVAITQSPAQVKYLTFGFTPILSLNWVTTMGFMSISAGALIPKILTKASTKAEMVSRIRSRTEEFRKTATRTGRLESLDHIVRCALCEQRQSGINLVLKCASQSGYGEDLELELVSSRSGSNVSSI